VDEEDDGKFLRRISIAAALRATCSAEGCSFTGRDRSGSKDRKEVEVELED
jgi:hypothetical protein